MSLVWVANFIFASQFAFLCLCQHSAIYQKLVVEMLKLVRIEGEWEYIHIHVEAPDRMKKRGHMKACM